ncbi:hypothetical protein [Aquimarina sp. 2304DJ70-9]|uniref:hypothetical protein n=1 Tax=Aquimarina penaris TaxID=3231044 RepID=UPI0034636B83
MKLYSFNTKDIPKSNSSKHIVRYGGIKYIYKNTEDKFKYNRLLLLGGITLFLVGCYFLIACLFLHVSSEVSTTIYNNEKSIHTIAIDNGSRVCLIPILNPIRNLNSIDYEKDVNPGMGVHVLYSENGLLHPNFMPNHWWGAFWVHSQVPINQQTGAVWIHRIQVTFFRPRHTIPSNHLQTNYKTILS